MRPTVEHIDVLRVQAEQRLLARFGTVRAVEEYVNENIERVLLAIGTDDIDLILLVGGTLLFKAYHKRNEKAV